MNALDFKGVSVRTVDHTDGIEVRASFTTVGRSVVSRNDMEMARTFNSATDMMTRSAHSAAIAAISHAGLSAWTQLHGRIIVLGTEFFDRENVRGIVIAFTSMDVHVQWEGKPTEIRKHSECLDAIARGEWRIEK